MREIVQLPIKQLKLLDNNPRKITKDQFTKLCESIQSDPDYFFNRPCLVNQEGATFTVYAGNQRIKAAKRIGWDKVPCIVEKDLPDEVLKKRVVLDNAHFGEFDWDILANNYDVSLLLECGLTTEQLVGCTEEVKEIEPEKEKEEKIKKCPHCDGIL